MHIETLIWGKHTQGYTHTHQPTTAPHLLQCDGLKCDNVVHLVQPHLLLDGQVEGQGGRRARDGVGATTVEQHRQAGAAAPHRRLGDRDGLCSTRGGAGVAGLEVGT